MEGGREGGRAGEIIQKRKTERGRKKGNRDRTECETELL